MTINIWTVIGILFLHWVGDFILQTDNQAKTKSVSIMALTEHVFTYTVMWIIPILLAIIYFNSTRIVMFLPITFICHWITDYFTSKINKRLWNEGNFHNLFVSIGFDQFLHFLQLLLTYKYLTQ